MNLKFKQTVIIFVHAIIGWALCGSIVVIGREIMSMQATMIVHAIGAPIIFGVISLIYFTKFNFTTPLQTALIFTLFISLMNVK